jgi:hypothetical protein
MRIAFFIFWITGAALIPVSRALAFENILIVSPTRGGVGKDIAEQFCAELRTGLAVVYSADFVTWGDAHRQMDSVGFEWFEGCPNANAAAAIGAKLHYSKVIIGSLWSANKHLMAKFQVINTRYGIAVAEAFSEGINETMEEDVSPIARTIAAHLAADMAVQEPDSILSINAKRRTIRSAIFGASVAVAGVLAVALLQNIGDRESMPMGETNDGSKSVVIEW